MSTVEIPAPLPPTPVASDSPLTIVGPALITIGSDDAPTCVDGACAL